MPPNGEQRIDEASSRGKLLKHVGELVSAEIFASTKLTKDEAAQIDAKINERNDWIRRTSFDTEFWRRSQRQFVLPRDVVHALRAADDPIGRHILGVDDDLKAFRANELAVVAMIGDFVQEEFIVSVLEEDRLKNVPIDLLKEQEIDVPEVRALVSSELAKLARPQKCPRWALWRTITKIESYSWRVRRFLFATLLSKLGALEGRELRDPEQLDAALTAALDKSPKEIATAAASLYHWIFGQDPPAFERVAAK
jgi:hypothetical protein